jgi:tetratricopeptide (TPR) repeat protein
MLGGAIRQGLQTMFAPPPDYSAINRAESVRLNNEGVALSMQGHRQEAIAKYRAAVATDRANAVAHANYFLERAQLDADHGRFADALKAARQAVTVSNSTEEGRAVTLRPAQDSVRFLESVLGERREQRRQDFAAQQGAMMGQMRPITSGNAPSVGDLAVTSKPGTFGATEFKPAPGSPTSDSTKGFNVQGALPQASSAQQSGTGAAKADSYETAKRQADCMFGTPGCAKPVPVTGVVPDVSARPVAPYSDATMKAYGDLLQKYPTDEMKGLLGQHDYISKLISEKENELATYRSELAAGRGDRGTLSNRIDLAKNQIQIFKNDLKSADTQIKEQVKKYQVGFNEQK